MKLCNFFWVLVFLAFAGCVAIPVGPGDQPSAVPPRIQIDQNKFKTWDRPGAFGPVPSELKEAGDKACYDYNNNMKAIGYHPDAQDEKGDKFERGGYLCAPK